MSTTTQHEVLAGQLPRISVVVPVLNEENFIESTLRQLLGQNYLADRLEVIVADGRSTDRTREIVGSLQAEYPNLHLVDNPLKWSSAGRNAAIQVAQGDLIVVVDGHCQIDDTNYLQNLADAFQRSGADCLGRPQPQDVSTANALQRAIASARDSWLGHHSQSFIYSSVEQFVPPQSVAVAYRREVFDEVGLFDESFDACEDVELNHRVDQAGFQCFFTPNVRVRYVPRSSLKGLFRQMARYGRGRVRLWRKHRDTFSIASFLPALFLAGVLLGPVFSMLNWWLAIFYISTLLLYSGIVLGTSASIAIKNRNFPMLFWLPLVFPAIHFGAGYGVLLELLVGKSVKKLPSNDNQVGLKN